MAQIGDLQVQYLSAIDTTAGNNVQVIPIPDSYPIIIGRGQVTSATNMSGEISAGTNEEATVLMNQLKQLCSNDSEIIFISFGREDLRPTFDGWYIITQFRIIVGPVFNRYTFSMSAFRLASGSLGTYFGAFGIEHEFDVTPLAIIALPGGVVYSPSAAINELQAEGGIVYVRRSTSQQDVYKLDSPNMPTESKKGLWELGILGRWYYSHQ
jgi:hypothetical protein